MQAKITEYEYMNTTQKTEGEDAFQETEIGLIPEDWEVVRLGDLFDLQQGKAMSPKARLGISPYPFLRTVNVLWGRVDLSTLDYMDFTKEKITRLRLQPDDLLVCEGGEIGRTAVWRGEVEVCGYQNHIHRLRKRRQDIQPEFYMYWMQAAFLIFGLYAGEAIRTTIPNLSGGRLKSFIVPKPPLPEQKKIAKVLGAIQRAIEQQDKIIEGVKNLKKSLMQKLFTEGLGHTEFKEIEIGEIPTSWKVVTLGEIGDSFIGGGTPSTKKPQYWDGKIPWITSAYITGLYITDGQRYISQEGLANSSTNLVPKNNVLIGTRVGVGKIAINLIDVAINQDLTGMIVDKQKANLEFVAYVLSSNGIQEEFRNMRRGTTIKGITREDLKRIKAPLPPLPEQQEIAHILSTVDKKIEVEERRKVTLKELFKTTLHTLMTGEIRLKDVEV